MWDRKRCLPGCSLGGRLIVYSEGYRYPFQGLQPISRRHLQVIQSPGDVQLPQLPARDLLERREPTHALTRSQTLSVAIRERGDHGANSNALRYYAARPRNDERPANWPAFQCGSGAKLEGRDHRVACPPRSPHETALLHPLLHPRGVQALHPPVNNVQTAAERTRRREPELYPTPAPSATRRHQAASPRPVPSRSIRRAEAETCLEP